MPECKAIVGAPVGDFGLGQKAMGASLVARQVKNLPASGRPGFNPWVVKIPWRRAWQSTPVFLPGESHGQRSLEGCSPWGCKETDTTELVSTAQLAESDGQVAQRQKQLESVHRWAAFVARINDFESSFALLFGDIDTIWLTSEFG